MSIRWRTSVFTVAAAVLGLLSISASSAADLRIGLAAEPTAIDPHYHTLTPNNGALSHVFERLVENDENGRLTPALAESWRLIDDRTWEFKLRRDVKWHDGTPFTADDVVFTMERAPVVPNSPGSFGVYIKGKTFRKIDDHTVHAVTAGPYPLMANDLTAIMIVSKKHGQGAGTQDYNSGKAMIGTGPYKFVEYVPGERIVVARNDDHWRGKPAYDRVVLRALKSGPTRIAALLAGDVDLIEDVPTTDIVRLKAEPRIAIATAASSRLVYFFMDHWRDVTPFATAKDGSPIMNPFKDRRVRLAFSKAINRQAIVERVMEGAGIAASQFLPDQFFGTSPRLKVEAYDPEGAKKLLAEAGFPQGFRLTMHGPSGRYTNDSRIIEAVAQMLSRVGIEAKVETLPPATFFTRASTGAGGMPEFSFILVGWSPSTAENFGSLRPLVATFDVAKGTGTTNRGRYTNPGLDKLIAEAAVTVDDTKRADLLAKATDIAIGDVAIIPSHYQVNTWAVRKGFAMKPRVDERTLAMSVATN